MSEFRSTIVIADWGQPHLLRVVLDGLIERSVHRHKILVVTSDPALDVHLDYGDSRARDWDVDPASDQFVKRFASTPDMFATSRERFEKYGIELIDVTAETIAFRQKYQRGEIYPGKTNADDGVDIAFKNNLGIERCQTEWVLPNWDADMFPGYGWDESLVAYAERAAPNEAMVPTHVQPHLYGHDVDLRLADPWVTLRAVANGRLSMPAQRTLPTGGPWVTLAEWDAFCRAIGSTEEIREACNERRLLHWNPMMVRKRDADAVGRYSYKGAGYDMELDTVLGARGFTKVSFKDSFILHKGYPPPA